MLLWITRLDINTMDPEGTLIPTSAPPSIGCMIKLPLFWYGHPLVTWSVFCSLVYALTWSTSSKAVQHATLLICCSSAGRYSPSYAYDELMYLCLFGIAGHHLPCAIWTMILSLQMAVWWYIAHLAVITQNYLVNKTIQFHLDWTLSLQDIYCQSAVVEHSIEV
jgi:hypothetical protein